MDREFLHLAKPQQVMATGLFGLTTRLFLLKSSCTHLQILHKKRVAACSKAQLNAGCRVRTWGNPKCCWATADGSMPFRVAVAAGSTQRKLSVERSKANNNF